MAAVPAIRLNKPGPTTTAATVSNMDAKLSPRTDTAFGGPHRRR